MEREVSELDRKLILKRTYLDKIYYHLTRDPIDQDELFSIVRKFFGEYLKLDYEFTYEELSQELNKVFIKPKTKEQIDNFLIRLSETEYLQEGSLGTEEINAYLNELGNIIKEVIYEEGSLIAESPSIIKKVLKMGGDPGNRSIAEINALMDETKFHINKGNVDPAKNSYNSMMKIYESLGKSDKKALHERLNEVYERLQELLKDPKKAQKAQEAAATVQKQQSMDIPKAPAPSQEAKPAAKIATDADPDMASISASIASMQESLQKPLNWPPKDNNYEAPKPMVLEGDSNVMPKFPSPDDAPAGSPEIIKFPSPQAASEPSSKQSTTQNFQLSIPSRQSPTDGQVTQLPKAPQAESRVLDETENTIENFSLDLGSRIESLRAKPAEKKDKDSSSEINAAVATTQNLSIQIQQPANSNMSLQDAQQAPPASISSMPPLSLPDTKSGQLAASSNFLLMSGGPQLASNDSKNIVPNLAIPGTQSAKPTESKIAIEAENIIKQTGAEKSTSQQANSTDEVITRLSQLISRTNDDIIIENLPSAKRSYKEALLLYRSLDDLQKAKCYQSFYSTFKKLDEAMHQKTLHELAEKHMSEQPDANPKSAAAAGSEEYIPKSLDVLKLTTLPIIMDNDPEIIRLYELIEESYFNISKDNSNLAMLKYFKALDLYKKMNIAEKKKAYTSIHDLFRALSVNKKAAM